MSHKKDTRLIWVKINSFVCQHTFRSTDAIIMEFSAHEHFNNVLIKKSKFRVYILLFSKIYACTPNVTELSIAQKYSPDVDLERFMHGYIKRR